ncbi:hypothetical protein XENTR_v10001190 [Xenopus tropicalis]|nr:hypothetical protein XENTR_v10001190 [Xenopus tropicalis]
MKSLKAKFKRSESPEWGRLDDKLMSAVTCNESDKVESLLTKKRLMPHKLGPSGRSALHTAAALGHVECLDVILAHQTQLLVPDQEGK